jgi:hypothetical protein
MIDQRAKSDQPGLPLTACAPDLFTRFDQLKPTRATELGFPVRFYMGFTEPLPNRATIRPDSWLGRLINGIEGDPKAFPKGRPNWIVVFLYYFEEAIIWWFWLLGYQADLLVKAKALLKGSRNPQLQEVSADIASKEIQGKWTGTDVSWATAIDQLARNYYTPTETISPGEAQGAYLANVIDRQALEDYSAVSKQCKVATDIRVETSQQRPDVGTMLQLQHRGIVDEQRVDLQARELGWLKSEYVQWQKELFWELPSPGEFIGWMRSGITSEETAASLQLDNGFDLAYNEEKRKWAEAAGLKDEQVKRLWRSTYQWPDAMQAIDWFHRSEAGYITGEDAVDEQELQDIISHGSTPPAYQGAVFASRFAPLGARLLRTAYDEGIANDEQVLAALRADGYSAEDAQILFSEWHKLKPKYTAGKVGLPSVGKLVSMYADSLIGTAELQAGGARLGLDAGELAELATAAQNERTVKHRSAMLATVKGSYMTGAISDSTMQAVLGSVLTDAANAADVAALWRAEFEARPRPDAAGELGKSYQAGLINEPEYVAALTQLRYSPEQIARILYAAEAANWGKKMRDAEMLVKHTQSSLTGEHKRWADEIKQAEKLAGKVEQRTRTSAGKLMSWIKGRVAKPPKKVSEKGPANGTAYTASDAALAQAAAFVEKGDGGNPASGTGIAVEGTGGTSQPGDSPG